MSIENEILDVMGIDAEKPPWTGARRDVGSLSYRGPNMSTSRSPTQLTDSLHFFRDSLDTFCTSASEPDSASAGSIWISILIHNIRPSPARELARRSLKMEPTFFFGFRHVLTRFQ